jgi:hypothetical protein
MNRKQQKALQSAIGRSKTAASPPPTMVEKESLSKNIREWATLFLVCATTAGVFWQVHEMIKVYGPIQEQAEATRESFAAVQRAFVTAKELGSDGQTFPTNQIFYAILENSGNTPTRNLEVFVDSQFDLHEINSPPDPDRVRPIFAPSDPADYFERRQREWPPQPVVIGPKGLAQINIGGPPKSHLDEMAKKRADGYVFGVAYYDDVFKGSKRHISKFCFVVQPVKDADKTKVGYGLCQHWNCADEECETDKRRYESMRAEMVANLLKKRVEENKMN